MSLHIAFPHSSTHASNRTHVCPPIAKAMASRAIERVANDNAANGLRSGLDKNDKVLHAALRHFAQHGMGAAREAQAQAKAALARGDQQAYEWWLGITHTLDRRLAREQARINTPPSLKTL